MALGTLTHVTTMKSTFGNKDVRVYDIQLTSGANYPTGGETITPANVGFARRIEAAFPMGASFATSGGATARTVAFNFSAISGNPGAIKMQVMTTASAEAANNSDQSGQQVRVMFIGV